MVTWQSDIGKITRMLLRHPKVAFASQAEVDKQWKQLFFTDRPDFNNAIREYNEFVTILMESGIDLSFVQNGDVNLDSIYIRDASICTDQGVILCNMGKDSRKSESKFLKEYYKQNGIPVLGEITSPGTLEGGDVAWITPRILAVGRGYRTNDEGIRQLKELTQGLIDELVVFHSPHYKGPNDVFHLMSVFSPLEKDMAVVYSPLMSVVFREMLLDNKFTLIEVPDVEFDSLGCNVLSISHGRCLMMKGNPITKSLIEKRGVEVIEYEGIDISLKGCGGPTCLTRPLVREI